MGEERGVISLLICYLGYLSTKTSKAFQTVFNVILIECFNKRQAKINEILGVNVFGWRGCRDAKGSLFSTW